MAETGTGLSRRLGKWACKARGINQIRAELVFRRPDHKCSHNPNEISPLWPELVFREIPGKLVQRRGQTQRFRLRTLWIRPLVDPPRGGITRVAAAPTGLGLLPACHLALRLPTGVLAISCPRVRPEPPAANRTRSLPGLWHGDDSTSSRLGPHGGFSSSGPGQFWKVAVGQFSQAPKRCRVSWCIR